MIDDLSDEMRAQGVGASVPNQALAVPVEPCGLAPPGFDPSRVRPWLQAMAKQGEDRVWRGAVNALGVLDAFGVEGLAHRDTSSRIAEVLDEGDGCWRTCSGCHEMCDGQDVGFYPWSKVYRCQLGSGCGDCGGLGVVWDSADYEDFANWSLEQDRILESQKRHLANIARGLRDVLSRLNSKQIGRDPKGTAVAYAEVPDWLLRQWLERVGIIETSLTQGIEARSDETLKAAQPEGQGPGPEGVRQDPSTPPTKV